VPAGESSAGESTPATIIVIDETVPTANHVTAEYTGGALMVGILWWLLYLRPRLAAGKVGIARATDPAPRGPAEPLADQDLGAEVARVSRP
jgi:hypothetical protein